MNGLGQVLRLVARALEQAEIPFVVSGSIASSVRGVMRATKDLDIVARITPGQAEPFAVALGRGWYVDLEEIRSALSEGRAFNVIYLPGPYKVDIIPALDAFHLSQLERAMPVTVGQAEVPIASAEDVVLAKLQWYRDGGEVSDRHWADITNVVATTPALDQEYLETWAARLGISGLLAKALADPGRER